MKNTTPVCYLHIGAPKTGTTALQKLLCDNTAALAAIGCVYPASTLRGFGHHDVAYLLADGYPSYATPQPRSLSEIEASLALEVSQHKGSIVLSSENFYLFPRPRAVRDFLIRTGCLDGRSCSIIVYVRRQDDAHESWYNQTIKAQGFTHDLATCVSEWSELWDYEKQLASWAEVFGSEALIVRAYETQQFTGGNLARDFFSIIDPSLLISGGSGNRVNGGLNRDILEFQRIVNKLPLNIQEKRRFHRELIELSERSAGSGVFDESPLLSIAQRKAILSQYAFGNAVVARTYLNRDRLFFVDPNRLSDDESELSAVNTFTAEKLALLLGWLLSRER